MLALVSPDEEVAHKAVRGDRAAWESLIAKHSRRVVVAGLAMGLSIDDARDLTQDVWVRLWHQIQSHALTSLQLPGIAVKQAQFLAKDLLRRRRTVAFHESVIDADSAVAHLEQTSAYASLASAQTLARVREELGKLSASHRKIFELATEEGLAHADIAERVGLSTQRVRQIIWEVRVRLREHVKGDGHA